jgi:hypothetical protein
MVEGATVAPGSDPGRDSAGDKTDAMLLAMFLDFYRQEVGAEEDVHRTLPFFATALGLIVAAVNYVAGQLPTLTVLRTTCPGAPQSGLPWCLSRCVWPTLLSAVLLVGAALQSVGVVLLLARAAKRRNYERIGPETVHVQRVLELRGYHLSRGLASDALDAAVSRDLRHQLVEDLAVVVPHNRILTQQRYRWRALAVSWLLMGLLWALAATIVVMVSVKSGFVTKAQP